VKQNCSHRLVVFAIVGTFAFVTITYVVTLCFCAMWGIEPPVKVSDNLKDVGLVALGALGSILSQTRSQQDAQNVNVVNPPEKPVQTQETSEP
jgi:hypothetical protein